MIEPMDKHFTLIAYRPDGQEYCRGCLMGSSPSAFEFLCDDNLEVVINGMAQYIVENHFKDREFCNWELSFLINGIYVSGTDAYCSSGTDVPDEFYKIWDDLHTKAAKLAGELVQKKKAEDIAKHNAQVQAQMNAIVEKERAELKRLLSKYPE